MEKLSKKFSLFCIFTSFIILFMLGTLVYIIDPYFHYHKPYKGISYVLNNQRYQNDGIVKHFDYDAIITGTSMTENFKKTEFDKIFGVNSIKVPFSGGSFKEINDNLIVALKSNKNIKIVIRSIDLYAINTLPSFMRYEDSMYPRYLYDDVIYNDIKYLLNKEIIIESIKNIKGTISNKESTSFDNYSIWYNVVDYGRDAVVNTYERPLKTVEQRTLNKNEFVDIKDNVIQNITNLADKYPNTKFYLFYPPYSIYYWDNLNQLGEINYQIDVIELATQLILEHPNIYLYSFLDKYDIICDLNNYKDDKHYSEKINSLMLKYMYDGEGLLNKNNYLDYIESIRDFYINFNYEKLFE